MVELDGGGSGSGDVSPGDDGGTTDTGGSSPLANIEGLVDRVRTDDGGGAETQQRDSRDDTTARRESGGQTAEDVARAPSPGGSTQGGQQGGQSDPQPTTGTPGSEGVAPPETADVMDTPEQGVEESGATESVQQQAQEFEQQILEENPGLTQEDVAISLVGTQEGTVLEAEFTEGAGQRVQTRLAGVREGLGAGPGSLAATGGTDPAADAQAEQQAELRDALEGVGAFEEQAQRRQEAIEQFEVRLEESVGSAQASAAGITDPLLRGEVIEETDLQLGEDFTVRETGNLLQIELTEQFEEEFAAEQRADVRSRLAASLSSQLGVSLDPQSDIEFDEQDGEISATLSETGERRVEVERAPIVGAAETLGVFEPEARELAGAAAEFRAFGEEQREEFVEPSLESLREATGLESEIEAFESLQDQAGAAEREFLQPAVEFVTERSPAELAAAGLPVAAAEPTPIGEVGLATVVGGAALAAGTAEAVERLSPEQQLAVGTAVGTATAPAARARESLLAGEVDSPTVRADLPAGLPGEIDAPERQEPLFDPELPATPGPFFVSELDVPLGRPTLQEIPVGEGLLPQPLTLERPEDPTDGAAGRSEVPINIEDGEVEVGPAEAGAAGEAVQRERPAPTVPEDPMGETVTGRELEEATRRLERQRQMEQRRGRRQQGVEAGEGVVLERVLDEPIQEELERTAAATEAEVARVAGPTPLPSLGVAGVDTRLDVDAAASQATATAPLQDFLPDFDLDTRVDTRVDFPNVQTTEFGRPTEFAEPTLDAPAFETVFATGVATPRVPSGRIPIPAINLDSEEPRRRERDLDAFEREFLEPVISPSEALSANRGGLEAMDLSDDST